MSKQIRVLFSVFVNHHHEISNIRPNSLVLFYSSMQNVLYLEDGGNLNFRNFGSFLPHLLVSQLNSPKYVINCFYFRFGS
jgi:hypothetical protein